MSRGGRGRGRFGSRNSVTQDLLRDNMEDLGIQTIDEKAPRPLFPDMQIPAPLPKSNGDIETLMFMNRLEARYNESPFFSKRKRDESSDEKKADDGMVLRQYIQSVVPDYSKYYPTELFDNNAKSFKPKEESKKKKKKKVNLDDIGAHAAQNEEESEKSSGNESEGENEDELEDEPDDYMENHDNSDDDGDDDGDGGDEAFF